MDFHSLKSDGDAMHMLRQVIREREPNAHRLKDDHVIAQLVGMLGNGELRLCDSAAGQAPASNGDASAAGGRLAELLRAIETAGGWLSHRGQTLRMVPSDAWRRPGIDSTLEIVPTRQARQILNELATQAAHDPVKRAAFAEAGHLLSRFDERPLEGAVVMLRKSSAGSASVAPRVTPSQIFKRPRTTEHHWIEIELIGEDGSAIRNAEYLIVAPDQQKHTGTTDGKGRARLERIAPGECKVSFPRLDKDAWRLA